MARHAIVAKWVPVASAPCGVCGAEVPASIGPRLCIEGGTVPVCERCAKRHAPDLAAVCDLAAKRVRSKGRL